jgi:hypothetical protein
MELIGDCQGFSAGYKDDYGEWHTYDSYCSCHQCVRFNPDAEKRLVDFIGWDSDGKCEFREYKLSKGGTIKPGK